MAYPTTQSEFDSHIEEMKPKAEEVSEKIASCTASSDVEPPVGLWEAVVGALFPIAGIYFGVKQVEYIIQTNPDVKKLLEEAEKGAQDLVLELGELLSPGNPFIMKVIADNWDSANRKLTGAVGPLSDDRFLATTTWTDDMGVRYAKVPAGQKAALESILPHLESMRVLMRTHADRILQLWWDIYEEIADFVIEALPLAANFIQANPLKWLEIAGSIAECISLVLKTIKGLVKDVFDFTKDSSAQIEALKSASSDVTGTDFGGWPRARIS